MSTLTFFPGTRYLRPAVLVTAIFFTAIIGGVLLSPGAGANTTFSVNSTADTVDSNPGNGVCATSSGVCTLRAAIQEANALPGADTIQIPAGTFEIQVPIANEDLPSSGDFDIHSPMTIDGAGAGVTIVDAGNPLASSDPVQRGLDRLFEIHPSAGNVTISDLTMQEGFSEEAGGAIQHWSSGLLTLRNVAVLDSYASKSGGGVNNADPADYEWLTDPPVFPPPGRIEIVGSTISGNAAGESGAAVNNSGAGTVSILAGSQVINNPGAMIPDPQDPRHERLLPQGRADAALRLRLDPEPLRLAGDGRASGAHGRRRQGGGGRLGACSPAWTRSPTPPATSCRSRPARRRSPAGRPWRWSARTARSGSSAPTSRGAQQASRADVVEIYEGYAFDHARGPCRRLARRGPPAGGSGSASAGGSPASAASPLGRWATCCRSTRPSTWRRACAGRGRPRPRPSSPTLARCAEAVAIGQRVFLDSVRPGRSELAVFADIRCAIEEFAGCRVPITGDFLSGAGAHRRLHRLAGRTARSQAGDPVMADLAPRIDGYWGDSCGTTCVGEPSAGVRAAVSHLQGRPRARGRLHPPRPDGGRGRRRAARLRRPRGLRLPAP